MKPVPSLVLWSWGFDRAPCLWLWPIWQTEICTGSELTTPHLVPGRYQDKTRAFRAQSAKMGSGLCLKLHSIIRQRPVSWEEGLISICVPSGVTLPLCASWVCAGTYDYETQMQTSLLLCSRTKEPLPQPYFLPPAGKQCMTWTKKFSK